VNFVGIELDEDYLAEAVQRTRAAIESRSARSAPASNR